MQFELTDEQRLLHESVLDWLDAHPAATAMHAASGATVPDAWPDFAELGWLRLAFPESDGGLGGGAMEVGLLMQAFGARLATPAWVPSVLVAGRLLATLGTAAQRERLLGPLMEGTVRLGFAHGEPGVESAWAPRALRARRDASGWRLSGVKQLVEDGALATHWLVSARGDDDRLRLFAIVADPRCRGAAYRTLQGGQACDLRFDDEPVACDAALGGPGVCAETVMHDALASGVLALCWAASGVMDMLVARTSAYVQERRQFGRSLSEFQAVQHKLAEMAVESLEARAGCELAALRSEHEADLTTLAACTKSRVAAAADVVGKHAIQLHGAMGVCEELPVAPAFRWLEAFAIQSGRPSQLGPQAGARLLADGRFARSAVLEERT